MNKGSKRVTIRIGDEMLDLVNEELRRRNANATLEPWCLTDYIMQALADKLNHARRGRQAEEKVSQVKVDPFRPREVMEE